MCLVSKHPYRIFTTERDLTCYKVLRDIKGELISPSRGFEYRLNEMQPHVPIKPLIINKSRWEGEAHTVTEGYHTFINITEALRYVTKHTTSYILTECIIPEGTKYVMGGMANIGSVPDSQVSETIKLHKVIGGYEECIKLGLK